MIVDDQIREHMTRTSNNLPTSDTDAALEVVLERAGSARGRLSTLTGIAASAAVVASVLVGSFLQDRDDRAGEQLPAPPAAPTGSDEDLVEVDDRLTRPRDTTRLGVEQLLGPFGAPSTARTYRWEDAADAADDGSDIRLVRLIDAGTGILDGRRHPGHHMHLDLAGMPTDDGSALGREVEYGIVLDIDGDRVADCELGITTHTDVEGQFRVWAVRLGDGRISEHVAPPSMGPFEFFHPHERGEAQMEFLFGNPMPECHSASQGTYFYTWAATLEAGEVVAIDYAPDAAWLETPAELRAEPDPDTR